MGTHASTLNTCVQQIIWETVKFEIFGSGLFAGRFDLRRDMILMC